VDNLLLDKFIVDERVWPFCVGYPVSVIWKLVECVGALTGAETEYEVQYQRKTKAGLGIQILL